MRAFLGLILGCIIGFFIVPIVNVTQGIEQVGALDGFFAIILMFIGGTWGLMIGLKSGGKHE